MDKYLEIKNVNPKSCKLLKFSKPYWNDNLTVLWKNMCKYEKLFLKAKGSKLEKRNAQNLFKEARNKFDKNLRKCERNYKKQMADNIESLNGIKPQEFWKHIQNLGPTKNSIFQ